MMGLFKSLKIAEMALNMPIFLISNELSILIQDNKYRNVIRNNKFLLFCSNLQYRNSNKNYQTYNNKTVFKSNQLKVNKNYIYVK